jgi:hypothetical protein
MRQPENSLRIERAGGKAVCTAVQNKRSLPAEGERDAAAKFHERRVKRNITAICVSGPVFRAATASPYEDAWGSKGKDPHFGHKGS